MLGMSKPLRYEERFCLFLDILGFKKKVEKSVQSAASMASIAGHSSVGEIFFSLKKIAESLKYRAAVVGSDGGMSPSSRLVTQFSDSVVVSYLVTEVGGLADILYDVLNLQVKLIQFGVLVRGAITKGLLHHDPDFVFGPALNEAVELEKLAMYPRVIVDGALLASEGISPSIAETAVASSSRTVETLLAQDLDGMFYVDYFSVHPDDFSDDWSELCEYLISLHEIVKGLASERRPSIRLKHSWMRQKFNSVAGAVERSQFRRVGAHAIPEDEVDHFYSVRPFK